jgi:hypothetical protein
MEGTAVKKWHKRKNTAAEGYDTLIYAHTTSRAFSTCDISTGSLTLFAPEAGYLVELILLYIEIGLEVHADKQSTSSSIEIRMQEEVAI